MRLGLHRDKLMNQTRYEMPRSIIYYNVLETYISTVQ